MKITTTFSLPSPILQYFNFNLLATPLPTDNSKRLLKIFIWIIQKHMKRAKSNPKKLEKCKKYMDEFKELYEQAKKKENIETETTNKTQEPFYRIEGLSRSNQEIFDRLRYKQL